MSLNGVGLTRVENVAAVERGNLKNKEKGPHEGTSKPHFGGGRELGTGGKYSREICFLYPGRPIAASLGLCAKAQGNSFARDLPEPLPCKAYCLFCQRPSTGSQGHAGSIGILSKSNPRTRD